MVETAALLVSELVTNAVLHAHSDSELVCRLVDGRLRTEVHDRSAVAPVPRSYDADAATGRGIRMVEALADDWGSEPHAHGTGKAVWFELALPAAARATAGRR